MNPRLADGDGPDLEEQETEGSRFLVLGRIADEINASMAAGKEPDVEALAARHPELAAQIRQLGPTLMMLHDLGYDSGSSADGDGSTRRTELSGLPDSAQLGDYRLLREVGRGGMGVVYEAEQISLGRRVALKVLPFAALLDPRHLERFKNEAQAAAVLHHQHIVPVFSVGCERGVHYYAMQFVEGHDLASVVDELRDLSRSDSKETTAPSNSLGHLTGVTSGDSDRIRSSTRSREFIRSVARLGVQAAEALEHAHELGVVHRDIKPSNLLIDERGELWITDFGLAKLESDSRLTMSGEVLGTLRYMSPEQARGRRTAVDHRTDIYSLGVTLYELLTLERVFEAREREALLRQITFDEPPAPRSLNRAIPVELETIVLKSVEKDPESRYATAQAFADDLERFLADRPILARRPSLLERARKWGRRHKPLVVAAVVMLALAAIGFAISTLLIAGALDEAEEERQAALAERQEALRQRDRADENLYVALMRLAKQDWDTGQVVRLYRNLARFLPVGDEPDRRGWEWYYWLSLCHRDLMTLHGQSSYPRRLSYSPDGEHFASGGNEGIVTIYAARNGREVARLDGYRARTIWSPDGSRLALGTRDDVLHVWDARQPHAPPAPIAPNVRGVPLAWTGGGSRIASFEGNLFREWEVASGEKVRSFQCPGRPQASSPDGSLVATIDGRLVRVWNTHSGEEVGPAMKHGGDILALEFRRGGTLASGSSDSYARVWNPDSPDSRDPEVLTLRHAGAVDALAWSWSGRGWYLATGTRSHEITVFGLGEGAEFRKTLRGHLGGVTSLAWSPDRAFLVSGSDDRTVKVWHAPTRSPRPFHSINCGSNDGPMVWNPDNHRLAWCRADGVIVCDVRTGEKTTPLIPPLRLETIRPHLRSRAATDIRRVLDYLPVGELSTVVWSPDGEQLAVATDGGVKIIDAARGASRTLEGSCEGESALAWSPDGRHLATTQTDTTVSIWEVASGERTHSFHPRQEGLCATVWSPDGTRLATAGWSGNVKIWDAGSWEETLILPGHRPRRRIGRVSWSPDGGRLASGGWDRTIKVWDTTTGAELLSFDGHTSSISSVSWSHDGKRIVSGDSGALRMWDATTGAEVFTLQGLDTSWVGFRLISWEVGLPSGDARAAWSPDGRRLAVSLDGYVRVLDASRGFDGTFCTLIYERGVQLVREGRLDLARQQFERALEIEPLFSLARDRLKEMREKEDG